MALDLTVTYPGQITTTDPNYPQGKARNVVTAGDGTGTPWEEDLVNDFLGYQQALLAEGGVTPSGSPDQVGTSDYLDAMKVVIRQEGSVLPGIQNWSPVQGNENPIGVFPAAFASTGAGGSIDMKGGDYDPITGYWILAGNLEGCVLSKNDGTSFIEFTSGMATSIVLQDVAVGGTSSAVACGDDTTMYRRDSILTGTWGTVTAPGSPVTLWSIGYSPANSRYIVIGQKAGSDGYAATSDDATGTAFTDRSASLPASFTAKALVSLAISLTGTVVGGAALDSHDKLAVSTDGGLTWADSTTTLTAGFYQVAYSPLQNIFAAADTLGGNVYTSSDGLTWTLKSTGLLGTGSGGGNGHGLAWYESILALITDPSTGVSGIKYSSDNGVTWTDQLMGFGSAASLIQSRTAGRLIATHGDFGSRCLRTVTG